MGATGGRKQSQGIRVAPLSADTEVVPSMLNFYSHCSQFSFVDLNSILTSFSSLCNLKQQDTYYNTHVAVFQLNLAQFSLDETYCPPTCAVHTCDQKELMLKIFPSYL
jgi:hypothetical protein